MSTEQIGGNEAVEQISEAEQGLNEATDLLNKMDDNPDLAKNLVEELNTNEFSEELRSALKVSYESRINEIRLNPFGSSDSEAHQNALVLQTYAVLYQGKTANDIGGIDGVFGKGTTSILRDIQKNEIDSSLNNSINDKSQDEISDKKVSTVSTESNNNLDVSDDLNLKMQEEASESAFDEGNEEDSEVINDDSIDSETSNDVLSQVDNFVSEEPYEFSDNNNKQIDGDIQKVVNLENKVAETGNIDDLLSDEEHEFPDNSESIITENEIKEGFENLSKNVNSIVSEITNNVGSILKNGKIKIDLNDVFKSNPKDDGEKTIVNDSNYNSENNNTQNEVGNQGDIQVNDNVDTYKQEFGKDVNIEGEVSEKDKNNNVDELLARDNNGEGEISSYEIDGGNEIIEKSNLDKYKTELRNKYNDILYVAEGSGKVSIRLSGKGERTNVISYNLRNNPENGKVEFTRPNGTLNPDTFSTKQIEGLLDRTMAKLNNREVKEKTHDISEEQKMKDLGFATTSEEMLAALTGNKQDKNDEGRVRLKNKKNRRNRYRTSHTRSSPESNNEGNKIDTVEVDGINITKEQAKAVKDFKNGENETKLFDTANSGKDAEKLNKLVGSTAFEQKDVVKIIDNWKNNSDATDSEIKKYKKDLKTIVDKAYTQLYAKIDEYNNEEPAW